ncbi:MAG TPA: CDP-alcohol phosphatidyltransferase family protein [Roseiarcus sp.]|nr:CDP-alcohol phosphatidyltransferase family protein [Roseiarcus sp.]
MSDPSYVPDRRPISARNHPWSIAIARWLAQTGVSPNAISTSGMIAAILAGVAFAGTSWLTPTWPLFLAAAVLMQLRLQANMFDGMVAIQTARASPVGELFNEVPDRVSDAAIFIGAGYAVGGMPELGYLAAVAALFTAYVRAEGKVAGAPQEFCGPMAKQQRMALLTVAALYAALPAAWQPSSSALPDRGVIALALLIIAIGGAWTALRRLGRIARALRQKG